MLEKALRAFEEFKERIDLKFELSDETDEQHLLIEKYRIQEFEKLNRIFENEYNEYVRAGVCFYGCPIEIYKNAFESRLEEYAKSSKDELALIKDELNEGMLYNPYSFLDNHFKGVIETALRQRKKFIEERLKNLGYTVTQKLKGQNEQIKVVKINQGEVVEKKFPDYCQVGALFAQGFIKKEKNCFFYKNEGYDSYGQLVERLSSVVDNIDKVRQYIQATLNNKGEKYLYTKTKMKKIIEYCKLNNIVVSDDFQSKYNSLNI